MLNRAAQQRSPLARAVRRFAFAMLAGLLTVPAVRCGGEPLEPSVGRCVGTIGAASFDIALDAESTYHVRHSSSGGSPVDVLDLRYGGGQVRVGGNVSRARFGKPSGELPIPPEPLPCIKQPR